MERVNNDIYFNSIKSKRNHKNGFKIFLIFILLICIIIASFIAYSTYKNGWGISGMLATAVGHDSETKETLEEFKVLILGVSTDISAKLTDTIIVASYSPKDQKATLLSIPRDTYIGKNKNNADSYDKINSAYKNGPEEILEEVNNITDLNIKYYVVIDTEALVELVDTIGGVEFDVPINMDYDDPTQDLHIHLKSGLQTLDGKQAEHVVRFRHNNNGSTYSYEYGNNDIGRMKTQREFLIQVLKQTISLKNVFKINELVDIAYKNVETNVSLSSIKDYIPYIVDFNTENIQAQSLPGESKKINGLWFFEYDRTKTRELIEEMYLSSDSENDINEDFSDENTLTYTSSTENTSDIKIELLNGSGKSYNLNKVTNILKQKGYNVYKTGTTATISKTEIRSKKNGSISTSNDIKEILGTGVIESNYDSSSTVDYTIIIGQDYDE